MEKRQRSKKKYGKENIANIAAARLMPASPQMSFARLAAVNMNIAANSMIPTIAAKGGNNCLLVDGAVSKAHINAMVVTKNSIDLSEMCNVERVLEFRTELSSLASQQPY